jgi:rubrerythrin
MSTENELSLIVDTARKTELDGCNFYMEAAGKTSNLFAKKMFESLVAAEQDHLKMIDEMAKGQFKAPAYDRDFAKGLHTIFSELGGQVKSAKENTADDIQALDVAIGMEVDAMAFYNKYAQSSEDENVRSFCQRMHAEEEDHWRILQNTRDYLGNTGDWYMVQEGWGFDGG